MECNLEPVTEESAPAPALIAPDGARMLVKKLMDSAKELAKDDKDYYDQLLLEIYRRFVKLNSTIVNEDELKLREKFLKEISKEVNSAILKVARKGAPKGQKGGAALKKDIARMINENEQAIYQVYPELQL